MKIAALIPAAGNGMRLGKGPKAFVKLGKQTLLERAIGAFLDQVDEIIVAVAPTMLSETKQLVGDKALILAGGNTRQASVFKLIKATKADFVIIHDAARPFLAANIIQAIIEAVKTSPAVTVAKDISDTLIEANTGKIVDRSKLKAIQTPQAFKRELILQAHLNALSKELKVTDDTSLIQYLGQPITFITGSSWLMKITTPTDLEIGETLIKTWDS